MRMRIRAGIPLFVFLVGLTGSAFAQLAPFQDESDIITPSFRYDIIRMKKISSITVHVEEKPDGKRISDDGIMQFYRFDTAARLSESFYTIKSGYNSWDTVRSHFYYDNKNHLVTKRTYEGTYYDTWYYVWYDDGMLKKEAHVHEANAPGDGPDFKIGTQALISCDSFAYNIYPKQTQRYGYNEKNTIYEKVITQYDDNRHMINRYSHYEVGWLYSQVDIKYDSAIHIKEYTFAGNLSGEVHKTTKLTYDKYGNMQVQKVFEGDKQTHQIEYLYDNNTGLISNQLDRDYPKSVIGIIRFSYTFFDADDSFYAR
jgi:hypothetical protein